MRTACAPYVVHLEDNEEHLAAVAAKMSYEDLRSLPPSEQDRVTRDSRIHPLHYPEFVSRAAGLTMVTPALDEFNLGRRRRTLLPPVVDSERFAPGPGGAARRRELGLRPEEFVLVYHGNMHTANRDEVETLYGAVQMLRRRGEPVRLVRLGRDPDRHDPAFDALRADVVEHGVVPRADLPSYLQMADAFVQPGAIDAFNAYRLPSKVPEFLAMARPVILPACNIGHELTDGENALLLRDGTAEEIAAKLEFVMRDRELARRLGEAGRAFAAERLEAAGIAAGLNGFLRRILS